MIDWSKKDGASPKPKRLHLEEDESDHLYHCPVLHCNHDGFSTQRGCRKTRQKTSILGSTILIKNLVKTKMEMDQMGLTKL